MAVRNIRRDGNDVLQEAERYARSLRTRSRIMEDELQKTTDRFIKEVDKAVEVKSKEVMTV